jgi:hypothetical protein
MVVSLEKSVAFVVKIAKISVGRGTKSHGCGDSSNEWRRGGRKERCHVGPTEVTTKIADVVPLMRKSFRCGAMYAKKPPQNPLSGVNQTVLIVYGCPIYDFVNLGENQILNGLFPHNVMLGKASPHTILRGLHGPIMASRSLRNTFF